MENKNLYKSLLLLNEISKIIIFRRKKIKLEISEHLKEVDQEIISNSQVISDLDAANNKLTNEVETVKKEIKHLEGKYNSIKEKYDIVSEILSLPPSENIGLEKFNNLFRGEFMQFANEESSLAEEAEAVLLLQAIEKELELIVSFPGVYSKNTIAIGGGFSSGKSAFVNSFFQETCISLPIGLNPVTAIPTYVIADRNNSIRGFSNNGGSTDIKFDFYGKLSYEFIKTLNFNLKHIMPFIIIGTPLDEKYFNNICLIDTPGYNPPMVSGFEEQDINTAFKFLEQANALIWMIGLDYVGTLPSSDLEFINKLDLNNKKFYLVLNKADLRSENDLEEVIDEIKGLLDDYEIPYEGISAYSANEKKEYLFKKKSLYKFLRHQNNPIHKQNKINGKIDEVFDKYKNAIENKIKDNNKIKSLLKSIELDILEAGYGVEEDVINEKIGKIKSYFDIKELNKALKKTEYLRMSMKSIVEEIFKNQN